ncbi:MAG TPA: hypothetical protein PL155_08550 [Candidatus Omnitrophota bacterium]|nr:hypothetical protein [Candidatus Omnitrophota bacterium]HPD85496.1 hypothetical protein [Candidatus Omnitrophota bacterium]HRZ04003.1 hypothetical protein [Candidatus Omnitrophota bacterium]
MAQETFIEKQEESISIHIFAVSAALVGVCLTVIGIFNIVTSLKRMETFLDEMTAVDAVLFMLACIFSYMAIRTRERQPRLRLEKIADSVFLSALFLMATTCVLIVLRLI